ncbi:hypothetical protein JHK87_011501 [Glycine soja]|nr:hypothetical protein JHK87_011501 [Glycine soja]
MALSKFCLNVAGDTPSSNRLFDAIVSHCVPVIISDEIELRFEDVLDYSEFGLFVHASDSVRKGYLLNLLRSIKPEKWTKMWARLKDITQHFEYQYPSQPGDAILHGDSGNNYLTSIKVPQQRGSKVIEGAGANSTFDCKSSTATAFRMRKLLTNGNSPSSHLRARSLLLKPETLNG